MSEIMEDIKAGVDHALEEEPKTAVLIIPPEIYEILVEEADDDQ